MCGWARRRAPRSTLNAPAGRREEQGDHATRARDQWSAAVGHAAISVNSSKPVTPAQT